MNGRLCNASVAFRAPCAALGSEAEKKAATSTRKHNIRYWIPRITLDTISLVVSILLVCHFIALLLASLVLISSNFLLGTRQNERWSW